MNPQSYRSKLETAIEQRDQLMLDELEQIAADSPATSRLWQEHCLLERAIEDWVSSPLLSDSLNQPDVSDAVTTVSPVISKKRRPTRSSMAAVSGVACLLLIGWIATNQNQSRTSIPSTDQVASTNLISPSTLVVHSPAKKIKRKPFAPLNHSYDLVEQSMAFLPSSVLPPVIPGVTTQITEEVSQTWVRISVLPEEMQQVWKNLNLPTENKPDDTSPAEKMPTDPKAPRKFSLFNMLS